MDGERQTETRRGSERVGMDGERQTGRQTETRRGSERVGRGGERRTHRLTEKQIPTRRSHTIRDNISPPS